MTKIEIVVVGPEFSFRNMQHWIERGPEIWRDHQLRDQDALCVDAKGRICQMGAHFQRAEEDGAYPITVYRKNPQS